MHNQSRTNTNSSQNLFKSGVPQDRILDFGTEPAFGNYTQFFPPGAIAHPAKANTKMLEWIIKRYTREGDLVLDPMAGTYSTCVIVALNNRNAIGVELEEKFHKWGLEAKRRIAQIPTLAPKGRMIVLKGDARELSKVFTENVDAVVFSPPFAGTSGGKGEASSAPINARYAGVFERCIGGNKGAISQDPRNIDNLPYAGGGIDVVIFSPPFTNKPFTKGFVICSKNGERPHSPISQGDYADFGPGDMGSLPYGTLPDGGGLEADAGDTYLGAMLQVYRECFKVLKPGGVMVLVTKNFIRNKKIVRLDLDTIELCEAAGFKFVERWYRRLEQQSFWRIIYAKKFHYCPRCRKFYRVRKGDLGQALIIQLLEVRREVIARADRVRGYSCFSEGGLK